MNRSMPKNTEQFIYLGPEEDLTNVSERLAQTQAQQITLVIPSQTQLRSHVSWRVLFSRVRKMGKDVRVISSDRQIRSMVKEAGFRADDSKELESPATTKQGRSRSRLGRAISGSGKSSQQLRGPSAKAPSPERTGGLRTTRQRSSELKSPIEDQVPGAEVPNPAWTPPMEGAREGETNRAPTAGPSDRQRQFGKSYDFQIDSTPPVQPKPQIEDEPEEWPPDIHTAQSIRQAAQWGSETTTPLPAEVPLTQGPQSYRPPLAHEANNELPQDDVLPLPLPEQRGSVNMVERDESVPDISDFPTEVQIDGEIEDQGDLGEVEITHDLHDLSDFQPPRQRQLEEPPGPPMSSHVLGVRPRNNRRGHVLPDVESEDALPPPSISDQDTLIIPPSLPVTGRPSGTLSPASAVGNRAPQPPSVPPQTRVPTPPRQLPMKPVSQRVPQAQQQARPGEGRVGKAVVLVPTANKKPPTAQKRGSGRGTIITLAVTVVLILLVVALGWLLPSADVTVYVPSQSFAAPLNLTASATSQQDVVRHTVHAEQLVLDTSVPGTGSATGSVSIATAKATGNVIFTNKSSQSLDIPSDTILSTSDGVQFRTTVDALIPTASSQGVNPPVSIEAVSPGKTGNVAANSITVIPAESITSIEKKNNIASISATDLTVTNTDPTTGGGSGTTKGVTQKDINTVKGMLEPALQKKIDAWLKQQVHKGDVQGTPVRTETPLATPAQGQVASDGTFTEVLKLHLTMLVVRAANLHGAASAELSALLAVQRPQFTLVPQQALVFDKLKTSTAKDGTSLALSFTATGQIMSKITQDQVRSIVAGKRTGDAVGYLKSSTGELHNIQNVKIKVSPDFFPWVPFWSERINVIFQPVPAKK